MHFMKTVLILAILALTACTQVTPPAPDTREADTKAIHDVEAIARKAWADKSAESLASIYAPNGQLIVPGMGAISGPADIQASAAEFFKDPNIALTFESQKVEISKSGDLGYSQGTYAMTSTNPLTKKPSVEKGTYVTVFQKQTDGTWKAVADINAMGPPEAPAATK